MKEKDKEYFSWVTSDNFEIIFQNFTVKANNHIGYSSGGIHTIDGLDDLKETTFQKPLYVNKPSGFRYNKILFDSLIDLRSKDSKLFDRIIAAIQPLYDSYKNSQDISWASRMLLLTMAFEILLELPESGQRKQLKCKFKSLLDIKYETTTPDPLIKYQSPKGNGSFVEENEQIRVHFAEKMYLLRNCIIHGSQPKNIDYMYEGQRMFDIGVGFFVLAIERLLNDYLQRIVFCDDIIWENKDRQFYWVDGRFYAIAIQAF